MFVVNSSLIQDVIDLKDNKWQKRREDAGPKTIEEIHADIKKEQLREPPIPL